MNNTPTIAIDAMGGDYGPTEMVSGAVIAARESDVHIVLVGDESMLRDALSNHQISGLSIDIAPSEGVISEGEHPALALRSKPKASILVAVGLVKQGTADAFISMGSTGATMAATVIALGKFSGLDRPTLGGPFLALAPNTTFIDLGANVDCKPEQLLNFGALGSSFQRTYMKTPKPRVALLSVGSEEGKGNKQVQEAFALFQSSGLNFIGNIEAHDVFSDIADVVVCDGFVGNILLKFAEGLATAAARYLSSIVGNDSPVIKHIGALAEAAERGGGPLFGVNGLAIVGHGRTKNAGVAASIALAKHGLEVDLVSQMREDLNHAQKSAGVSTDGGKG